MKKLIKLFSIVTMAAAGVFGLASVKESKKAESADAASTTVYLHASAGWTDANAWFAICEIYSDTYSIAGTDKVYYVNSNNWGAPKAYMWDSVGDRGNGWPGRAMNKVGKSGSYDVYEIDRSLYNSQFNIIFSNNGSSQTANIEGISAPSAYQGSSTTPISNFSFTKDEVEHWSKMTSAGLSDSTFYRGTAKTSGSKIIFVRMNPASQALNWDNKWNQTYDLSGIPSNTDCYQIDNQPYSGNAEGSWHLLNQDGDNIEYARGTFGRDAWSMTSAIKLVSHSSNELKVTLPLKSNDEFRFYVNRFIEPGYETSEKVVVKGDSPIQATISNNNIVMPGNLTEGAYIIYWSYADSNWGLYITSSVDTSESLATYVMQSDSSGQCTTKFAKAKTRFLAMTDASEIAAFKASVAAERYEAWARAMGEKPYEEGTVGAPVGIKLVSNQTHDYIILIVLISVISVTAIGGYFFIRRRKEN